jgi:hypothetical protein
MASESCPSQSREASADLFVWEIPHPDSTKKFKIFSA